MPTIATVGVYEFDAISFIRSVDAAAVSQIIDIRQRLDHIIAKHTGQDYEKVRTDTERDYFMSSEEAKDYGIIDRVISEH